MRGVFTVIVTVAIGSAVLGTSSTASAQQAVDSTAPTSAAAASPATAPAGIAPATAPATGPATTTAPAADPLATPESAVPHLFKLMRTNDVTAVRQVLIDPPPSDELRQQVALVARRLDRGATFELLETQTASSAAAVLYRTRFASGRTEVAHVLLLRRYDRWKVILGTINPKRYTSAEKEGLVEVAKWAQKRLPELNAPATAPAAPTTAPSAAATATTAPPPATQPAK